jgi:hypothetical protein
VTKKVEEPKKGPLKCWGCGEAHMLRDCPHRKHEYKIVYHVQDATMINDVSRSVPKIYAVVENRQEDHQASIVELEGIISKQPISILIDPGSNLSYVSPQVVEACTLHRKRHAKAWLV